MTMELFEAVPEFSDEDLERCRQARRPMPVLWEVYRYVTMLAVKIANIDPRSPACREHPRLSRAVTCGLANRCARLMGASMDLTTNARNREALAILSRAITESATKLSWVCRAETESRVRRFVANGLGADLEFRTVIESNVVRRGGTPTAQEARMLRAIGKALRESGLTEGEIRAEPRLPDMYQMLEQLGYDRPYYVAVQRMPSHAVHGNWSDLVTGYLNVDSEPIRPRSSHAVPSPGQYVGIAVIVLPALIDYVGFLLGSDAAPEIQTKLHATIAWVNAVYEDVCSYELDPEDVVG
jgi:hypothetical protein